ncbi:hypothetical protein DICPUDRAFT_150253 [Dictyostelium purpureum]|uniref:EGF-like domain-containing protein n=1 Tax=Dictyostelium purpureum TaxID=5786 RepID=F0ZFV0_DICPU|nr:uncharacterized protein DICPUDRAFT_150253 [Dictyostelium purpureum]EGC37177.1 hypothetical protein DICPUDRAFT_150253 [Dictyostelium purpureum]|eukprot:XP_003286305.1 hypothetical protein DICPUDRAFT_150253 [Dictyostelium purpureum]
MVYRFSYSKKSKTIILGYEGLVSGSTQNGIFEYIVDLGHPLKTFNIHDPFNNVLSLSAGSLLYKDSNDNPVFFNWPVLNIDLDIENVTILKNDIDILNKECYNTIYFNSSTIPHDYPLVFNLLDPVSQEDLDEGIIDPLPIRWSEQLKLFYCDFIVPKNTGPKTIPYQISSPFNLITNEAFTPLRVSKTRFDNDGPLITSLSNTTNYNSSTIGWRMEIIDFGNGFSKGYIKAVGSFDSSILTVNFTSANVSTTSGQGTIYDGEYNLILDIDVNKPCKTQLYTIEYIYLEDTNKRFSVYSRFDKSFKQEKDPLRYVSDSIPSVISTNSVCKTTISDESPPRMSSFSITSQELDVGSFSYRFVNITIIAEDDESGILYSQRPKAYITASDMQTIMYDSEIQAFSLNKGTYLFQIEIPVGFGYPDPLLVSIYGIINTAGFYTGYSNDDPDFIKSTIISTSLSGNSVLLGYEPLYYYSKSNIIIYGRLLSDTDLVVIAYSNGTKRGYSPVPIGQSILSIPRDDFEIVGPFDITAFSKSHATNTLRVNPIYYEKYSDPKPTSTPIPTNKPQRCLGSPLCGGADHGTCIENQGCVCNSPWIGIDCLSQVIIIPPPKVNNTDPTIEIPITDGGNSGETNTTTIFYKSLISLVSLREISINNTPVEGKTFRFEKWTFKSIDSFTNQYHTTISVSSTQTTNVTVTLKWYENETIVEFANQNLKMNPSSIKYTIEIQNFPFESSLNSLQLIMQASFLSNKIQDTCSAKEFGDTTSGDNSNYLKIQIENKSLYGRFIKRCITDDASNIFLLENQLLDSEMNAVESPNQIQTYIGIKMPWFEHYSIIDPDFSVLVNSDSASSLSNSNCSSKDSKLSTIKIVGIVIGCVAFVCIVSVAIIYSIQLKKKESRFIKKVDVRLKSYNSEISKTNE